MISVYRETEKMYLIHRDATRDLIGLYTQVRGLSRIKKADVRAFETLLEALKYLQIAAVDRVADAIVALVEAEELVIQIDVCVKAETEQSGVVAECLAACLAKKGVQK